MPSGSVVVVMVGAIGVSVMVMENICASLPLALVAVTVKVNVPATVGVPEITPVVALRVNPSGKSPEETSQVIGAVPVAARVVLYDTPVAPLGKVVVVITGGAASISIESIASSYPPPLVARMVKVNVPTVVGFPEMTPLFRLIVNPSGKAPLSTLHETGAKLVAASVAEYAVPTTPLGKVVVVISGKSHTLADSIVELLPAMLFAITCRETLGRDAKYMFGVPEMTPVAEQDKPIIFPAII